MANLMLTEAQVAPEKQVVLEERRQRVDNDPAAILAEEAQAARYLNHPYRRPIIGWQHEIAALTTEDVVAFYRRWYAPNNAVLVVTGDVTPTNSGRWPSAPMGGCRPWRFRRASSCGSRSNGRSGASPCPTRAPASRCGRAPIRRRAIARVQWSRPIRSRFWPNSSAAGRPAASTGRWWSSGLSPSSAGADYEPSARGPSDLVVYASPRPGVSLEQLEEAVVKVVGRGGRRRPQRRRGRPGQAKTVGRRRLRPRFLQHDGAPDRRGAGHRPDHRRHRSLAGAHPRRRSRRGRGSGTSRARPAGRHVSADRARPLRGNGLGGSEEATRWMRAVPLRVLRPARPSDEGVLSLAAFVASATRPRFASLPRRRNPAGRSPRDRGVAGRGSRQSDHRRADRLSRRRRCERSSRQGRFSQHGVRPARRRRR